MPKVPENLTGQKFYQLTAVKLNSMVVRNSDKRRSNAEWLWRCDCGKEVIKLARYVKRGFVRSCGCHVKHDWKQVAHHVYNHYKEPGGINEEDFIRMSQLPCYYCGQFNFNKGKRITYIRKNGIEKVNYWEYHGLDRLDNNRGHTLENCVTSCWRCNEKKKIDSFIQFKEWITDVYHNLTRNNLRDSNAVAPTISKETQINLQWKVSNPIQKADPLDFD